MQGPRSLRGRFSWRLRHAIGATACLVEKTKEIFCPSRMCVSVLARELVTETRPRVGRYPSWW